MGEDVHLFTTGGSPSSQDKLPGGSQSATASDLTLVHVVLAQIRIAVKAVASLHYKAVGRKVTQKLPPQIGTN